MKEGIMKLPNRNGIALVSALFLTVFLLLATVGFLQVALNASKNETASFDDAKAFSAAESGLHLGAAWINRAENADLFFPLSIGATMQDIMPGLNVNTFTVRVDMEKTSATGVRIISTAQSAGAINYNKIVCQNASSFTSRFRAAAFNHAILCDGPFDFGGCGNISAAGGAIASLHSNSSLNITGNASASPNINITSCVSISVGNRTVDANLEAPVLNIHNNARINGLRIVDSVNYIEIPDIDLLPYFHEALYNNEVRSGFNSSNSYTPSGGILWVNGDVQLSGGPGTTFNGMIVATGNIHISGQVNVNAPGRGFALASEHGDIQITTSGTINGLVYAKNGDYRQTANGRLNGQLVVKGSISKGGNSDIVVYDQNLPFNPNTGNANGYMLEPGTWREENQ